ncbi:MAG: hypothetical protein QOJ86_3300 [Bradyrhizobium sp.]|nr:hypothetical protein [Bradyrhizobium sp.]
MPVESPRDEAMPRIFFFLFVVLLAWAPVIEALARTEP